MALIFMEGFDKYGPPNIYPAGVQSLLLQEWNSATSGPNIVAGLSAAGYALGNFVNNVGLTKNFSANYSRIIGGVRFSPTALGGSGATGFAFYDAGTAQCAVTINAVTGTISVRNGTVAGTALATSAVSVAVSSIHYLEWDITFGNAGAYQVWLDGVSILSGTGDTTGTANNYMNQFAFSSPAGTPPTLIFDDLYLFDTSGTTNNAVLLTSPRVETQLPNGDGTVQFAVGAAVLGTSLARTTTAQSSGAVSSLMLRRFTPPVACTINSICITANVTSGTPNLRPALYADSSGTAGSLLSSGSIVTGVTVSVPVVMPLTTPQVLTAGTQYWLGVMVDQNLNFQIADTGLNLGYSRTGLTFASGAPNPAGTITGGFGSFLIWGILSGIAVNWYETSQNPSQGASSYVYDATVGHEDLYNFPALSVPPTAIYAVAVKANISKSDAGAKTASVRLKSGSTDSAGTGGTAIAPGTSFAWATSLYERDPNGSIAWTQLNLNAAQAGIKVET